MTISFPLTVPSHNIRRARLMRRNLNVAQASIFTGQQQVQAGAGEWWALSVELPPMKRDPAADWYGFLTSLRGTLGTFEFGDPTATTPLGTASGTPLTNGVTAVNSFVLNTDGWGATETVLKRGDYIELTVSGKKYLHAITADAVTNGSGEVTLDIWPRTRVQVGDGVAIVTASTKGTFRLAEDVALDIDHLHMFGQAFEAVEAF